MVNEKPKIGVCIPMYKSIPSAFFIHFLPFFTKSAKNYKLQIFSIDSVVVDVSRNVLVSNFLRSDCEYLLFLDSDMVFPPNIIDLLIRHDKDVVSALYFLRKKHNPCFRFYKDGNYYSTAEFPKNKLIKVDAAGLGCILIKRKVLEDLEKALGDKPFFATTYKSREHSTGEDVYFCEKIREQGSEIFVDTSIILGHYGGIIPEEKFKGYIY